MNPDISDLALDELRSVRKKLRQIMELLSHFVSPGRSPVYASLLEADDALESAEAEVLRLRHPDAPEGPPAAAAAAEGVTYRVAPEDRTVYLTVAEGAPFDAFANALRAAMADPAYRSGFNVLADCTRMRTLPDQSQLRRAADFFSRPADVLGRPRWAMVARSHALRGMQSAFGGLLETSWGAQTRVFQDAVEARQWLSEAGA